MNKQAECIRRFYTAFQAFDTDTMASCYHADITFQDPAFGELKGEDVMHMWRMLVSRGQPELTITFTDVRTLGELGSVKWEAKYPFSMTGRSVHNIIHASFSFRDDKIIEHTDEFDLYKWSKMAFGWKGVLFGNFSFFKNNVRSTALQNLNRWKAKHAD